MGFWKSERGICGDGWADEMGACMKRLEQTKAIYDNKEEHEINIAEFADLVEFCSRGHIIAKLKYPEDGDRPLSQLFGDPKVETYPNRGQIHS